MSSNNILGDRAAKYRPLDQVIPEWNTSRQITSVKQKSDALLQNSVLRVWRWLRKKKKKEEQVEKTSLNTVHALVLIKYTLRRKNVHLRNKWGRQQPESKEILAVGEDGMRNYLIPALERDPFIDSNKQVRL